MEVKKVTKDDGILIIGAGDIHIRETTPQMRIEESFFEEVVFPKLEWLVQTCNDNNAILAIAGDIFDSAFTRYELTNRVMSLFARVKNGVVAVPGQHDMNYHSQNLIDTPYQTLSNAGVITNVHCGNLLTKGISFFGMGFGAEIPDVVIHDDVMLTHFPITEDAPPFFMEEAMSARDFIEKASSYFSGKIIISGDFHQAHVTTHNGVTLFNCGPFYRKEKTQVDIKPRVYLINPRDCSYETLYVPIKPGDRAFDLEKIRRSEEIGITNDVDTTKLKELMQDSSTNSLQFEDVVSLVCSQFKEQGRPVNLDKLKTYVLKGKESK